MNKIIPNIEFITKIPVLYSFFSGVGLYHAIYVEKNYLEIPIPILLPLPYLGYKLYKDIDNIPEDISTLFINEFKKEIKKKK
jgi:hypothetical protein